MWDMMALGQSPVPAVSGNGPTVKEAAMRIYLTWTVMAAALMAFALAGFAGATSSRTQFGLSDATAEVQPQRAD